MAKERAILQAALLKRAALTDKSHGARAVSGIDLAQTAVEAAALIGWAVAILSHCL